MTTTQTPADIKLLELPEQLRIAMTACRGSSYEWCEANLRKEIESYALACVEADRKERNEPKKLNADELRELGHIYFGN